MNERSLFDAALKIADPTMRKSYLDQACAGSPDLRARIESLLKSHDSAGSFLEVPLVDPSLTEVNRGVDPTIDFARLAAASDGDLDDVQVSLSFLQPSVKPNSLGKLAHYEILNVLGQGAFGIVFKAFDEKLHRLVAIKVMNPQMAATSPPRKRFLREARAAAAIRHENVVQVHSVEEQPLPYLVMEYIDGQTLQEKLDGVGPLELVETLHIGRQIASGLAAAHATGLIHRDIKPGNILLEKGVEQKVKITDFGLARAADDASMTRTGTVCGTPMYMAPEQALGQTLDHRADLFSFGSVLYLMACGRPPFRAPTTIAVLRRVADEIPRPMQEIIPEIPDWLAVIVNKLHAKCADDRFQTAKEVVDLLTRCQSELQLNGQVTCVPADSCAMRSPSSTSPTKILTVKKLVFAMLLGAFIMFPILYGRHLSRAVNTWLWPKIPTLPAIGRTAGLQFDGKDDYVKIPVDWSYPQFTIEAFVTSDPQSDNGTIAYLTSLGNADALEWMSLYEDDQAPPGQRLCGAAIFGKTPYAGAYGLMTPGVRQHRVLVFNGSHLHYYINGIWQGKRRAAAHEGLMWKMKEFRLGCNGADRIFFQGTIDQVRVSKVARYNDNFPPVTSVDADEMTLALYTFDEGQNDVLKDASGNGNDGQIHGATWVNAPLPTNAPNNTEQAKQHQTPPPPSGYDWPADAPAPAIAPFNAEQAKHYQEAWAKYFDVPVEYTNSLGMKFRLIPPGEFLMGSTSAEIDSAQEQVGPDAFWQELVQSQGPQHRVILAQPFYLGAHEVTQAQYERLTGQNPSQCAPNGLRKSNVTGLDTSTFPVENNSWNDVADFCSKLSIQEQFDPMYSREGNEVMLLKGNGYQLPTEAQWEFACRAGTTTRFWTGDDEESLLQAARFSTNGGDRTHAVGELRANPFGMCDMHGNVWEWVQDEWDPAAYAPFKDVPAMDPLVGTPALSPLRVMRSGGSGYNSTYCQSAFRSNFTQSLGGGDIGFRLALSVDAVKVTK